MSGKKHCKGVYVVCPGKLGKRFTFCTVLVGDTVPNPPECRASAAVVK